MAEGATVKLVMALDGQDVARVVADFNKHKSDVLQYEIVQFDCNSTTEKIEAATTLHDIQAQVRSLANQLEVVALERDSVDVILEDGDDLHAINVASWDDFLSVVAIKCANKTTFYSKVGGKRLGVDSMSALRIVAKRNCNVVVE
eukprot:TRINITY_DN67478_c3_g5_i3.p1 TRINITY_DN67478_c3_g5~~TRINITY_DN67478_c3_g5_i3.p1  ORF type:complete len:145 (+),score=25.74 TRINITY_DN67478_c3_g5_i3:95-529(+)